jgi:hypothetical protein
MASQENPIRGSIFKRIIYGYRASSFGAIFAPISRSNKPPLFGSLLNGEIHMERMFSSNLIKQRSQLWWRGRLRPRLPKAPQHDPRVQPSSYSPQCYRP